MLQVNDWVMTGLVGDKNYPDLSMQKIKVFGTRESVPIPLNTPIAVLGDISAAYIWWESNELKGTEIRVFTKIDNEQWQEVKKGKRIPSIRAGESYIDKDLSVRFVLTSTMTEINPARNPELYELIIVFYGGSEKWDDSNHMKLVWRVDK